MIENFVIVCKKCNHTNIGIDTTIRGFGTLTQIGFECQGCGNVELIKHNDIHAEKFRNTYKKK